MTARDQIYGKAINPYEHSGKIIFSTGDRKNLGRKICLDFRNAQKLIAIDEILEVPDPGLEACTW